MPLNKTRLSRKFSVIMRRFNMSRKFAWLVSFAAAASGIATYVALTSQPPFGPNPETIAMLLTINVAILLLLGVFVFRGLMSLWAERKKNRAGSKMHVRLVALLAMLAIVPTIIVASFSAIFFHLGVEAWFSERVDTALTESRAVAQAYLREHQEVIRADIQAMAKDINREAPELVNDPIFFSQYIETQTTLRSLAEAVIFDRNGRTLARSSLAFALEFEPIPPDMLAKAEQGDIALNTSEKEDRVRALIRLESLPDSFLYVGRLIDPAVLSHMEKTNQVVEAFEQLSGQRADLQILFAIVYIVVALLLLFAAVGVGLTLATKLVRPIGDLIEASERVAAGDLSVRVDPVQASDEISSLSLAFNRMTNQLDTQRRELIEANRQIDTRRRFTEAVLAGVPAGVIGLDARCLIQYPNRMASELLGMDLEKEVGKPFLYLFPDLKEVFMSALTRPDKIAEKQIQHTVHGKTNTLSLRLTTEYADNEVRGFVVTIDDVSELLQAQRTAAWADVARRLAHEIRNPLTPIQLSAERLNRKYLKQITEDAETFTSCTDTIIRHVADLNRMLEEFSAFARMPTPTMKEENPLHICRESILLQRHAHPEIQFELDMPEIAQKVPCDSRQVRQALTNLLKNAVEAIEGRTAEDGQELPPGKIILALTQENNVTRISVTDNGKGLPVEGRERLIEPYITTRAKGTGLGLAIVKKIMEDHKGELLLEDSSTGGAKVTLVFFPQQSVNIDTEAQHSAA